MKSISFFTLAVCGGVLAAPTAVQERQALPVLVPTVTAPSPKATYVGSSVAGVDSFNNIPFAVPPVGTNRLFAPSSITTPLGVVKATGTPRQCPQQASSPNLSALNQTAVAQIEGNSIFQSIPKPPTSTDTEDCLILNIQRPSGTTSSSKLPVVFWIYGGGFEAGGTGTYNAQQLITKSVVDGLPILYVNVNYRLSAFGFLGGKDLKKSGNTNLGLLDQRLGLKWVADNIAAFGGDPSRVTIWGESAGSISVLDQMVAYNGNNLYKNKPLFHGAVMDSGSIVPANPVDGFKAQGVYDAVVKAAGCSGQSDTLKCLRSVSYDTFKAASDSLPGIFSYNSLALSYLPRPDGTFLADSPEVLVQNGKITKTPFIVGDQEDEGTLFSLVTSNVSTTDQLVDYLHTIYFPDVPRSRVAGLVATYPTDPSAGSPFRTGPANELYPQFKRIAALLGDITFTLSRRGFLNIASTSIPNVPSWSYLGSYFYQTVPFLGTFHATDILEIYGYVQTEPTLAIQSYYISFFNSLDPNAHKLATLPTWPQWKANKQLLQFNVASNNLLTDDFRSASYNYLFDPKNTLRI